MRYEVRVPKEETAMVSDLRYGWKKLRILATQVSDNLTRLQVRRKHTHSTHTAHTHTHIDHTQNIPSNTHHCSPYP